MKPLAVCDLPLGRFFDTLSQRLARRTIRHSGCAALTTPKVTHRAALTEREAFAGLLRAIWAYEGSAETQAALKLMAYLHTRPGEL